MIYYYKKGKQKMKIIEQIVERINIVEKMKKYKRNNSFTRKRKLGFKNILLGILTSTKHSLSLEIDKLIEKIDTDGIIEFSKQAYSKARQNLKPEVFLDLNNVVKQEIYANEYKTFKGYRVSAIDGSVITLPNTKEMKEKYGIFSEGKSEYPAARISVRYDVFNKIILDQDIVGYRDSERQSAEKFIKNIEKESKEILILDRGYPSVKLLKDMQDKSLKYVFRVSGSFLKEVNNFRKSEEVDQDIVIKIDKARIEHNKIAGIKGNVVLYLRCVRIKLENTEEILITNMEREEITVEDLKYLYKKRWEIETNYNTMKNVLELENFTGDTDIAVKQDIYATILLINISSVLVKEAQEKIDKKKTKSKYKYKINVNIAVGIFKKELIDILLEEDSEKAIERYNKLIKKISKYIQPVREGRKYERPLNHNAKFGGRTNKRAL